MGGKKQVALSQFHPELALEFHPTKNGSITADDVAANFRKSVWWLCNECEHEWQNTPRHRSQRGQGCPACAGKAVHVDGRNSLAMVDPDLASEWHPERNGDLTPDDVTWGSAKRIWWLCNECEHEWRVGGDSRISKNTGCPACAGKAVHVDGRNSLTMVDPNIASEWHPEKNGNLTPDEVTAGTGKRIWWLCNECEHEWATSPKKRVGAGQNCPACAPSGFQPHLPGQYYVHEIINNETRDRLFFKAGISGDWEERLLQLRRGLPDNMAMNNLEVINFEIGRDALDLETRLKAIHDIRAPRRSFGGGDELFLINPLDYARENNLLDNGS